MKGYRLFRLGKSVPYGPRLRFRISAEMEDSTPDLRHPNYGWLWSAPALTAFFGTPAAQGGDFEVETLEV